MSAFVNFEVDHLKKKKKKKKKKEMMMMKKSVLVISVYRCSCGLPTLRVLPCIETLVEQAVRLKRLKTAAFESSEALFC